MIKKITPRSIHFHYKDSYPKYWFDNDVVKTYHANVLAAYIPYTEKFIINCVKAYRTKIKDPQLQSDVKAFIQQESYHTREHFKFLNKIVLPHYPKLKVTRYKFFILLILTIVSGKKVRLAMTAAGEHFTSVISDLFLSSPELFKGIDPTLAEFWRWHFIEEIEHKAVTFDLLKEAKCGYFVRAYGFVLATLFYISGMLRPYLQMAYKDKLLLSPSFYFKSINYFWGNPGIMRKCFMPYIRFLKPNFHPWQVHNDHLIDKWLKASEIINKSPTPES